MQLALRHPTLVNKLVSLSATYRKDGWYPSVMEGIEGLSAAAFAGTPVEEPPSGAGREGCVATDADEVHDAGREPAGRCGVLRWRALIPGRSRLAAARRGDARYYSRY